MLLNNNYYVYFHYKLDTNEIFYIGKGLNKRAFSKKSRNKYWNNVINKHGYKVEIVEQNLTEDEAYEKEIFYIEKYKKEGLKLVNLTNGGKGCLGLKNSKIGEFSKSKKGINHYNCGKKRSDVSDRIKGKNHHNYGKIGELNSWYGRKHNEETKLKMSKSKNDPLKKAIYSENMKKCWTQERRKKISLIHKGKKGMVLGKHPAAKKIINNVTGIIYNTIKEAALDLNLNYGTLKNRLNPNNTLKNNTNLEFYL
jgi:hypothetical protein